MENIISLTSTFQVSNSKLWKALTENAEMKLWYFNLEEFKPVLGFTFSFVGGPEDGIQYKHICVITEVVPEHKLVYSWRYDGYDGISYVSFEIREENNQTTLHLTHTGVETFPKDNPDFAIENFRIGWESIVNTSLRNYLNS